MRCRLKSEEEKKIWNGGSIVAVGVDSDHTDDEVIHWPPRKTITIEVNMPVISSMVQNTPATSPQNHMDVEIDAVLDESNHDAMNDQLEQNMESSLIHDSENTPATLPQNHMDVETDAAPHELNHDAMNHQLEQNMENSLIHDSVDVDAMLDDNLKLLSNSSSSPITERFNPPMPPSPLSTSSRRSPASSPSSLSEPTIQSPSKLYCYRSRGKPWQMFAGSKSEYEEMRRRVSHAKSKIFELEEKQRKKEERDRRRAESVKKAQERKEKKERAAAEKLRKQKNREERQKRKEAEAREKERKRLERVRRREEKQAEEQRVREFRKKLAEEREIAKREKLEAQSSAVNSKTPPQDENPQARFQEEESTPGDQIFDDEFLELLFDEDLLKEFEIDFGTDNLLQQQRPTRQQHDRPIDNLESGVSPSKKICHCEYCS
ncbi:hypothetical protein QAD02_018469 [Eretmocerus hayati]|uniref:Uncharacterized protein n=1 Tax=Eretmocerus hayati TaxID=131215 RepID=A0ACC2PJT9_9HYME|nr:hypothetical protein QAD02_018469 [Eretmocerus hayati]